MDHKELEEQMKQALSDKGFAESLIAMETPEEVQTALQEKGIGLSLEDISTIRQLLENGTEGELSEDELETVAGGSLTVLAALGIASLIMACVGGTVKLGDKVNTWTRRRW